MYTKTRPRQKPRLLPKLRLEEPVKPRKMPETVRKCDECNRPISRHSTRQLVDCQVY